MKTAEEILEKHLLPMIERTKESYASIEEMKAIPEWNVVINAMEEYAQQQVINHAPDVMPRLFVITAQEGWNEMFWDKEKAQHKIDTQYKKDFPNDEFWIEEVNVS